MDYPMKGNPLLIRSIQEWMADRAEMSDSIDFTSTSDFMKDFNKRNADYFKKFYLEDFEEGTVLSDEETPEDSGARMSRSLEFEKTFEDNIFVTYLAKDEIYLNGAHGSFFLHGATFRKSDGRRFGFDMLKSSESDSICSLISKNMEAYYNVKSWNELKNYLSLDEYAEKVPMPQNPPYLKGDTLIFVYQQYEIASYASGMPEAAVPLKELKGLLSPTFVRTLNGK